MKSIFLFIFLSSISIQYATSQDIDSTKYPFEDWKKNVLIDANNGRYVNYMTPQEAEVVFYCNLARMNGPLFNKTYLQLYLDKNKVKKTKAVRSLKSQLNRTRNNKFLRPRRDLSVIAQNHATSMGRKGKTGHTKYKKRYNKTYRTYRSTAENCYYGENIDPLHIALQLLIDEGVANQGHRNNILNSDFNSIGVSIQPHSKFTNNCVMSFGRVTKQPKNL